jgi:hypothetical protein
MAASEIPASPFLAASLFLAALMALASFSEIMNLGYELGPALQKASALPTEPRSMEMGHSECL